MIGTMSHIARREQQIIPWVSQLYPQCCLVIQPFSLWLLRPAICQALCGHCGCKAMIWVPALEVKGVRQSWKHKAPNSRVRCQDQRLSRALWWPREGQGERRCQKKPHRRRGLNWVLKDNGFLQSTLPAGASQAGGSE